MRERLGKVLRHFTVDLATEVDAEAAAYRAGKTSWEIHRRTATVILTAIVCLLIVRFAGDADDVGRLLGGMRAIGLDGWAASLDELLNKHPDRRIHLRIFWCIARVLAYGVIPMLFVRLVLRERLGEYGFALGRAASHVGLYVAMASVVLPLVIIASFDPSFQAKYPYYRAKAGEPLFPNTALWEVLYGSQFLALEFFFRGFFIHGLRPVLGYAAVFMPLTPYVMIHYGKPLPEAIGSIVTGFVLGSVSLRTRSVWGGAAIHMTVAWTMDIMSLWHRGLLFP
jgi:membrane protease YdiL (CAAX protease family)